MKRSVLKLITVFFVLTIFAVTSALAAATADKKWFVIKDSKGVCKVIQAKEPPKAIDGPFDKKEDAEKAKAEKCPKKDKKDKKDKPDKKQ